MGTSFGVWEACSGRGALPRVTGLQPLPSQRPMLQVTWKTGVEPAGRMMGRGERGNDSGQGGEEGITAVWRTYRDTA